MSGPLPSHPELLDNLAVRFMENGWSVKVLIREIATSRAYQLSSQVDEEAITLDPENTWFARGSRRRLEAEAIRDAMLAIGGNLQTDRPQGSLISEFGTTLLGPGGLAQTTPPGGTGRFARPQSVSEFNSKYRSVYLPIARNAVPRSLEVFDFPDPSMSMGQREESNTATQSLYLLNNEFVIEQAQAFARRVSMTAKTPRETIELAFRTAYGRAPTSNEVLTAATFLRQVRAEERVESPAAPLAGGRRPLARALIARRGGETEPVELDALTQFCQALLASAEFRYLN